MKNGPCTFPGINYVAYSRTLPGTPGNPSLNVVYLLAAVYPAVPATIDFQNVNGQWTLMQTIFQFDPLPLWIVGAGVAGPFQTLPQTIPITDGFGTHTIEVLPWNGDQVSGPNDGGPVAPGTTGPCNGADLGYLGLINSSNLLFVVAGCVYPAPGISLLLEQNVQGTWTLTQTVPAGADQPQVTAVATAATQGASLTVAPTTVTVADSFGGHVVPVFPYPGA